MEYDVRYEDIYDEIDVGIKEKEDEDVIKDFESLKRQCPELKDLLDFADEDVLDQLYESITKGRIIQRIQEQEDAAEEAEYDELWDQGMLPK